MFARKSMSWTRIFTEMEKIVPADLHVVSMKPEYTKTNDLVLHIVVATDSRDRAVELVRHMEKSTHFRQPQVVAETVVANTSEQSPARPAQYSVRHRRRVRARHDRTAEESQTADNSTGAAAASPQTAAPATAPGGPHKLPMPPRRTLVPARFAEC